jgi:hypothetical protein
MGSLGTCLHWDCSVRGDPTNITPCARNTYAQNEILSLLIIHIIPRHQIYVAIDNPLFIPYVSCLATSSYL